MKPDWDGLIADVEERFTYLRLAWEASEKSDIELHKKMVDDLYLPALRHLAAFCASIEVKDE
jgi:hypothetical protein